jgi:hypothetical protein
LREAEALEKIYKEKAKEQQLSGLKQFKDTVCKNSDKRTEPIDTKIEVSKLIGTSHDTLHKKKIISEKKPKLLDEIDSGKRSRLPNKNRTKPNNFCNYLILIYFSDRTTNRTNRTGFFFTQKKSKIMQLNLS